MIKLWKGVCIHHSESQRFTTAEEIDRWHRERTKPFRCIGYHFCVRQPTDRSKPEVIDCARFGRTLNDSGAHARGHNSTHIGICLIGNFNKRPPTDDMLTVTAELIRNLFECGCLVAYSDGPVVQGHRDLNDTDCPGKQFDLERLRRLV